MEKIFPKAIWVQEETNSRQHFHGVVIGKQSETTIRRLFQKCLRHGHSNKQSLEKSCCHLQLYRDMGWIRYLLKDYDDSEDKVVIGHKLQQSKMAIETMVG